MDERTLNYPNLIQAMKLQAVFSLYRKLKNFRLSKESSVSKEIQEFCRIARKYFAAVFQIVLLQSVFMHLHNTIPFFHSRRPTSPRWFVHP